MPKAWETKEYTDLLVWIHTCKPSRLACLASFAGNFLGFLFRSIGEVAWIFVRVGGHDVECERSLQFG